MFPVPPVGPVGPVDPIVPAPPPIYGNSDQGRTASPIFSPLVVESYPGSPARNTGLLAFQSDKESLRS